MANLKTKQVPPLSQLYVYVTNACNCACKHCWIVPDVHSPEKKTSHFLSPDLLEAAIQEAQPLGLSSIKWTGGEPTIHPDFPRLLEIQRKHRLGGRLETNGMEISPELARLLQASGVNHIAVSLDGATAKTHDAIRGIRGGHRRTLNGLKNLVETGYRPQLIMSLMTDNVNELEDLLNLAENIGAGSVKFNLIQPTLRGRDIHQKGHSLSISDILALNRKIDTDLRPHYPFQIFLDIPIAFRSIQQILEYKLYYVCGVRTILGLLAEGHYSLCGIGENLPELVFGRVGRGELPIIWRENPLLLKIRDGLPKKFKGICGRCLMSSLCLGSCIAQNYYRNQDLTSAFWFCDQAGDKGLFPEARLRY